jgi:spoIIIJ-associated protein
VKKVEVTAKTVEEAIQNALKQLQASVDQVDVNVVEQPSRGLFGLIGAKDARVEVSLREAHTSTNTQVSTVSSATTQPEVPHLEETREVEASGLELGKQFLQNVLSTMDVQAEIHEKREDEYTILQIVGPKLGLIIGRRGQTLDSLQYLVNVVVNRNQKHHYKVLLDAENYRERRQSTLESLADRLAMRAIKTKRDVVLEPMNPAERKIIHSKLQDHPQVSTHSTGEEPHRKVVISYKK